MSEHFEDTAAPYANKDTFVRLWSNMNIERRRSNIGLFVVIIGREPTEEEIEKGTTLNNPQTT